MSDGSEGDRYSVSEEIDLISDPDQLAEREAANGLRQFDQVLEFVEYHLDPERPFNLRLSPHQSRRSQVSVPDPRSGRKPFRTIPAVPDLVRRPPCSTRSSSNSAPTAC